MMGSTCCRASAQEANEAVPGFEHLAECDPLQRSSLGRVVLADSADEADTAKLCSSKELHPLRTCGTGSSFRQGSSTRANECGSSGRLCEDPVEEMTRLLLTIPGAGESCVGNACAARVSMFAQPRCTAHAFLHD